MKDKIIIGVAVIAVIAIAVTFYQNSTKGVWINCGLSEISPDFTSEMREACRQARSNHASRIDR
jgi:hypothetical protein